MVHIRIWEILLTEIFLDSCSSFNLPGAEKIILSGFELFLLTDYVENKIKTHLDFLISKFKLCMAALNNACINFRCRRSAWTSKYH